MSRIKYIWDIETNGLYSISSRVTCISLLNITTNKITTFLGEDESVILTSFWNLINQDSELIGYNSDGFDWSFIVKRSIINNVKVCDNYTKIKLTDLRKIVNQFFVTYSRQEKGTLNDWAVILGFGEKTANGKQMLKFFADRDFESIKQHCEEDIQLTKLLYDRCINTNVIIGEPKHE